MLEGLGEDKARERGEHGSAGEAEENRDRAARGAAEQQSGVLAGPRLSVRSLWESCCQFGLQLAA